MLEVLYRATDGRNCRAQRLWMTFAPISTWQGVVADANGNVARLMPVV